MKDEIYFWPQKSLVWIFTAALLIKLFFPLFFPQTSLIFHWENGSIYIPSDCIQHEFFVHFICGTVIKTAEIFVFFDITEISFCLDLTCLPFQNSTLTLDVCMGFFTQFLPLLIDLHYLVFLSILWVHCPVTIFINVAFPSPFAPISPICSPSVLYNEGFERHFLLPEAFFHSITGFIPYNCLLIFQYLP